MKKNLIVLCALNVLSIGLLVYKTKHFNSEISHMQEEMNLTKSAMHVLKHNFQTCLSLSNKYEARKLSNECDLKLDKPKLIFRFTDYSCDHCIEQQIRLLNDAIKKTDPNNILIVVSSTNKRNVRTLIKRFGISFSIVSSEFVIKEIDQYNLPYYFVLGTTNKIMKLFIPDVMFEDTTRKYLNEAVKVI